jgi:hypothetical protein
MPANAPLTIEIIGKTEGRTVVLDRVIGGTIFIDEAKRIGQRLLSIVDAETAPTGYRILSSHDHDIVYDWQADQDDQTSHEHSTR